MKLSNWLFGFFLHNTPHYICTATLLTEIVPQARRNPNNAHEPQNKEWPLVVSTSTLVLKFFNNLSQNFTETNIFTKCVIKGLNIKNVLYNPKFYRYTHYYRKTCLLGVVYQTNLYYQSYHLVCYHSALSTSCITFLPVIEFCAGNGINCETVFF